MPRKAKPLRMCPFCGHDKVFWSEFMRSGNAVRCRQCGAFGPQKSSLDAAAGAWNRRATEAGAKVTKMWGMKNPAGDFVLLFRATRSALLRVYDGTEDQSTWRKMRKEGYRAVRVTVREDV